MRWYTDNVQCSCKHIFHLSNFLNSRQFFRLFFYFISHLRPLFSHYRGYILSTLPKWWCACICCLYLFFAHFVMALFSWAIVSFNFEMSFVSLKKLYTHFCCDIESHTWHKWWWVCHAFKAYCSEHVHVLNRKKRKRWRKKKTKQNYNSPSLCYGYSLALRAVSVCWSFLPFAIFACSINISAFRLCNEYYKPFCCGKQCMHT